VINITVKFFVITVLFFNIGCTIYKPKVKELTNMPDKWSIVTDNTEREHEYIMDIIGDKELKELIEKGLKNNLDLIATAKKLKANGILLNVTKSKPLPNVDLGLSTSGTDQNPHNKVTRSYKMSVNLSWEIDLWGKLGDLHQSAKFTHIAESYNYKAARNSIVSMIIKNWIETVRLNHEFNQLYKINNINKRMLETAISKFIKGVGSSQDIFSYRIKLDNTEAEITKTETELFKAVTKLEILTGSNPKGILITKTAFPVIEKPELDIPLNVITGRPDVRTSYMHMMSLEKNAVASSKAFLPSISLSSTIYKTSENFNKLGGQPHYFNAGISLIQPLLNWKRITSEAKASKIQADAAFDEFKSTALKALNEIVNLLKTENQLEKEHKYRMNIFKTSQLNNEELINKYTNGQVTEIEYMESLIDSINHKRSLFNTKTEKLTNRVNLIMALGMELNK